MLLNRPPAKDWKVYDSIPGGGQAIENPNARHRLIGVVFLGDGDFVSHPSGREDDSTETVPVEAGQFWALNFDLIHEDTTALPLVVLWGPLQ